MDANSLKVSSDLPERCFFFSIKVIKLLKPLNFFGLFQSLITQFLKAATSVGANITESKFSVSRKEFCRYYEIALKSGNEAKYWLRLLIQTHDDINKKTADNILSELTELTAIIAASIKTMRKKK